MIMNWFNRLMQRRKDIESSSLMNKTTGEIITELTGGRFLVHGKPVYELARECKNDIEIMLLCCDSELEKMNKIGQVAAPFYFERAAIIARKNKNYKLEVDIIERYITELEGFYRLNSLPVGSGVMAGPRFSSIVSRLEKSKQLLERNLKSE
uniref:hypothetical protein n=2 Tax=Serratia entomophila TaxID=42906 RepID=UPI001F4C33E2|nr:hypothetical protein [Serratia entomophila]